MPEARRQGVAAALLFALEEEARGFGYDRLWLQTALRQPEAIALYDRSGYARIPCFGDYGGDPLSVCYEKSLGTPGVLHPGPSLVYCHP